MISNILKTLTGLDINIENGICTSIRGSSNLSFTINLSDYCNSIHLGVFNTVTAPNIRFCLNDNIAILYEPILKEPNLKLDIINIKNEQTAYSIYENLINSNFIYLNYIHDNTDRKLSMLYKLRYKYEYIKSSNPNTVYSLADKLLLDISKEGLEINLDLPQYSTNMTLNTFIYATRLINYKGAYIKNYLIFDKLYIAMSPSSYRKLLEKVYYTYKSNNRVVLTRTMLKECENE